MMQLIIGTSIYEVLEDKEVVRSTTNPFLPIPNANFGFFPRKIANQGDVDLLVNSILRGTPMVISFINEKGTGILFRGKYLYYHRGTGTFYIYCQSLIYDTYHPPDYVFEEEVKIKKEIRL
jgi:hypothetical protein